MKDASVEIKLFEDLQYALALTCRDKLMFDRYVDLSEIGLGNVSKVEVHKKLSDRKSKYVSLYEKGDADIKDPAGYWFEKIGAPSEWNADMTPFEARCIISWFFHLYNRYYRPIEESISACIIMIKKSVFFYENPKEEPDIQILKKTAIIYDSNAVEIKVVRSVPEYLNYLMNVLPRSEDKTIFYRGHSKVNYQLLPGIMRRDRDTRKYLLLENERRFYNEIQVKCPDNFKECKTHLEKLVIMQHYGIPTRLMDVTSNPLVALYFVCRSKDDKSIGEVALVEENSEDIKWPASDTASLLSSLAALTMHDQDVIASRVKNYISKHVKPYGEDGILSNEAINFEFCREVGRLLGEVKTEKPGFEDNIIPDDLLKRLFIFAPRNNQRIVRQEGSFILFGLPDFRMTGEKENEKTSKSITPLNDVRVENIDGKKQILLIDNKTEIRNQLELIGINEATMFPEIEDVAETLVESALL